VFGAIDGTVTTFAVVAGAAGADLSSGIIVIMGLANLFGDGFSMGVGNYLGLRTESERVLKTRRNIIHHIEVLSHGPRAAVRQVYASKGFEGDDLELVVDVITADRDRWADTLLSELHGLQLVGPAPIQSAFAMFFAFVVVGAIPLLPFVTDVMYGGPPNPVGWGAGLAGCVFFLIGAVKSRVVEASWWRGGLEALATGGMAASLAFAIGIMLKGLVESA
jgi:VIT1/CCC1 family predicted Fe2+/Mn2+ transporter